MIFPWQKLIINKEKLNRLKGCSDIARDIKIEPGVHITGPIKIGQGTILKSGTYIEGPVEIGKNCILGPNCYLRKYTMLEDNVKIGASVEIKNSIIGEGTKIPHLSYVGDSVIGKFVNIGAGTITANLRHDHKSVKSLWRNKLLDTETSKFGCYIGNYSKIGIHNTIYPGIIINDYVLTLPGQIIKRNIKSFSFGDKILSEEDRKNYWSL